MGVQNEVLGWWVHGLASVMRGVRMRRERWRDFMLGGEVIVDVV